MTTDIGRACPLSWKSPCLAPNSKACCWERCIKRKSNDGSGLQVEGFIMPKTEGGNQNISCESSWSTMPQIHHCTQNDSCNLRKSRSSDVVKNEKIDTSSQSCLRASKSGALLQGTCLVAESDTLRLASSTNCPSAHRFVQSQHIQGSGQGFLSKKRVHVVMSAESACDSEHFLDKGSQDEIIRLREALKVERKALRKLHKELEEERCASAAAAIEAMAMIRRLQEEKSAALVESRHYKLASEEREAYNQEAIALLKEALSVMENEVRTLQEHTETYRSMLLKMKSGQGNLLEGNEEEMQLLLLEGNKMAPCSLVNSNEFLYHSQIGIRDVTEEEVLKNMTKWQHRPAESTSRDGHDYADTFCEDRKSDVRTNDVSEVQDLDDVSMSILDRVARLEERFACLGHNQEFDSDCFDRGSHDMTRNLSESEAMKVVEQNSSPVGSFGKLREGFVVDDQQNMEGLKHTISERTDLTRVPTNSEHWERDHCFSPRIEGAASKGSEIESRGYSRGLPKDIGPESKFPGTECGKMECIYNVYAVHCDPKSCEMPPCSESCESEAENAAVVVHDALQFSEGKLFEGSPSSSVKDTRAPFNVLEGCNALGDGKSSAEMRLPDGEAIKSFAGTDDVQNLKLRLQALEGERAFMKVAIDSLRKENLELKLLQDIAQQLRELKGDVWKTGVKGPGHHEQLPFLSFLKRIFSFAGIGSHATTEKRRFLYPFQESSKSSYKEQGQAGLFYVLNYPFEEERHMRVTRECKLKFSDA